MKQNYQQTKEETNTKNFMEFSEIVTQELDIVKKLQSDNNFSFARYGDGEWACIKGKNGRNCDAHIYYPRS